VAGLRLLAEHRTKRQRPFRLVILSLESPQGIGRSSCADFLIAARHFGLLDCPVVVFARTPSYEDCVTVIKAGAHAYVPGLNDEDWAKSGALRTLCEGLLNQPPSARKSACPSDEWMQDNYEWLCKRFGGQWVAIVPLVLAREVGVSIQDACLRDGLYVLTGKAFEDVRDMVLGDARLVAALPAVAQVPVPVKERSRTEARR
jgi:hypothetical protein